VLNVVYTDIDCFLYRNACVSSVQLNNPIWRQERLSPRRKYDFQEILISKTNSGLTVKQCARNSCV
jgi:hypothetical protein